MKRALISCVVSAFALGVNPAFGHEGKPRHGGVVATANDISYELVTDATGATLHVLDHDKPVDTSTMGGKLTVLTGAEKSEVELKPAGGNKLEAKPVSLRKGAKAVASVRAENGKVTTVRFNIR